MAKLLSNLLFAYWLIQRYKDGCGYMMGATGQYCKDLTTGSWLVAQYKDNATQYAQAKYWLSHAPRVFDCQGMADCYVTEQTGVKTNVYARNNYANWCSVKGTGTIPAKYRVPGAAVFIHSASSGYITHVGFLVEPVTAGKPEGDWYVIEARGVMYGVVRTKLLSRSWNRWGLMDKYFDYEGTNDNNEEENTVVDHKLGERTLKKGMQGNDVQALQVALMAAGYKLPKYGADGDFGAETESAVKELQKDKNLTVDGIYGAKTHAALMADTDDPKDAEPSMPNAVPDDGTYTVSGGSVYLWDGHPALGGNKTSAIVHKGDSLPKVGNDTYVPITYNGVVRWINAKYLG